MMHTDGTNVNRKIAKGAATRVDLLVSGRRLFGSKGYAETSTEDIALDAGVTKGALYHHFSGKDDVMRGGSTNRSRARSPSRSAHRSSTTSRPTCSLPDAA